jgi:hypothetical protein
LGLAFFAGIGAGWIAEVVFAGIASAALGRACESMAVDVGRAKDSKGDTGRRPL